jgi:hypothetical protein
MEKIDKFTHIGDAAVCSKLAKHRTQFSHDLGVKATQCGITLAEWTQLMGDETRINGHYHKLDEACKHKSFLSIYDCPHRDDSGHSTTIEWVKANGTKCKEWVKTSGPNGGPPKETSRIVPGAKSANAYHVWVK